MVAPGFSLEIRIATRHSEISAARYLIASTYYRHYRVVFSRDGADPSSNIEPYPHRYVMGIVNGELVAAAGMYLGDTYVQRYGGVTAEEIAAVLAEEGLADQGPARPTREYTKLVVKPGWEGFGLGRFFLGATHSKDFVCLDAWEKPLLLACAKVSIFDRLYKVTGIRSRPIKAFPRFRVHRLYSDLDDPMESRLIIPELDIHPNWYNLPLPGSFEVNRFGAHQP